MQIATKGPPNRILQSKCTEEEEEERHEERESPCCSDRQWLGFGAPSAQLMMFKDLCSRLCWCRYTF
jgi:hypothetical protein